MTNIDDKELVQSKLFNQNIGRLSLFVIIIIPVNILHILYFYFHLQEPSTQENIWRFGIIYGHAVIMFVSLLMGIVILLHKRRTIISIALFGILFYVFIVTVITAGIGIVTVDQLVTPAITPFLIICLTLAMVFLLSPEKSLPIFLFAFVLFYIALGFTQDDPSVLLSNRINGLTISGVAFLLSWIIWRSASKNVQQEILIGKQREDLEQRNKQLHDQSLNLETAISSRDRFLSIISHDLKSPFNSLLGFSDILLEDWEEMDDHEKKQIIHFIKETSETTYQLLLNLLDWSRLQKKQITVQRTVFSVRQLIDNVLSQLNAQANLKGIVIRIDVDPDFTIHADEHMVTSILRNLISNAIKFSAKDSTITIHSRMDGNNFLCCVEDQGVGLPAEIAANIFETPTSTDGTAHEQGTGLGLQLCLEFVMAHKGNIWVDSKYGEGSRFYYTIPQE